MKIGVTGCTGRMGSLVVKHLLRQSTLSFAGCATSPNSEDVGRDIGTLVGGEKLGIAVSGKPERLFEQSDLVIDFSAPAATAAYAELAASRKVKLVTGTTGL